MFEGRKIFGRGATGRMGRYCGSIPKKWKMDPPITATNLSLHERFSVFSGSSRTQYNCRPLNNKQLLLRLSKEFVCGKAFSSGRLRLAGSPALDNWRLMKLLALGEEMRIRNRRREDGNVGTVNG
ncbi:unnamed protein product [Nezara viridula]|uniref:Uncharacterized protein n=1 Tax=Nezara viridula TaxID=85310 RepID=A0A9P0HTT2_NEZVI|nr:unnamed protein product [Nezara viridula]